MSTCFDTHAGVNTLTHNILQNTIATIALENGTHTHKKVCHLFPIAFNIESIFLSQKMVIGP
jgi:hypothetical protein